MWTNLNHFKANEEETIICQPFQGNASLPLIVLATKRERWRIKNSNNYERCISCLTFARSAEKTNFSRLLRIVLTRELSRFRGPFLCSNFFPSSKRFLGLNESSGDRTGREWETGYITRTVYVIRNVKTWRKENPFCRILWQRAWRIEMDVYSWLYSGCNLTNLCFLVQVRRLVNRIFAVDS